jgi:hypothetical protein
VSRNAISYCSELKEILGTIDIIDKANNTETDQICINDAAVTIVNLKLTPNDMLVLEAEIILACQKRKPKSTCLIKLRWVRGHQDKGKESQRHIL